MPASTMKTMTMMSTATESNAPTLAFRVLNPPVASVANVWVNVAL